MASTKAKGSSKNGRDSRSKRLGVKIYGGQAVTKGMMIVRQRGSKFYAGTNVGLAGDDSIYAKTDGVVNFARKRIRNFTGKIVERTFVSVK